MSDSDLDAIGGGATRRALLALPVLALVGVGAWWLMRPTSLGEPELAHRVLIIGSAQADLSRTVSPAGFEADQESWGEHEGQDLDTLIDYADEHGYGFLTLVFDDAAPWPATELDASAPENTAAVAIGIGDLRERGADPVLNFGAPVEGIEADASLRALIGLRIALYDHPDLLRLWDNPTPAQRTQQVHLGSLEDRRTELHARLERQREAVASWPFEAIPANALSEQWVDYTGLPLANGVVFERAANRLVVDAALTPRLELDGESQTSWLAYADFPRVEAAKPVELPRLADLALSANRRFVASIDGDEYEIRRWTVGSGPELEELPAVRLRDDAFEVEISNTGKVVGRYDDRLSTADEVFYFRDDFIRGYDWLGEDVVVASITGEFEREGSDQALVFLDARPLDARLGDDGAPPTGLGVLTVYPEDLNPGGAATGPRPPASVATWAIGGDALFVLINVRDGNELRHLLRVEVPPQALRQTERHEYDKLTRAETAVSVAELRGGESGVGLRVLGQLPRTRAFLVADDGGWVAWWDDNEQGTLQAAPVTKTGLGEVMTLTSLGEASWSRSRRPYFAGPRSLLVPGRAGHALGEASFLQLIEL